MSYFLKQSYEEAFEKLKEATNIDDIDLLVSKFIEVEDKNFALFNYVNELNNDVEILQEQINLVGDLREKFTHCLAMTSLRFKVTLTSSRAKELMWRVKERRSCIGLKMI